MGMKLFSILNEQADRGQPVNVVLTETRNGQSGWRAGYEAYQG